jgi:hypothetical protein
VVESYLKAKNIGSFGNTAVEHQLVEQIGITKNPDLYLEFETIFSDHIRALRKSKAIQAELERKVMGR